MDHSTSARCPGSTPQCQSFYEVLISDTSARLSPTRSGKCSWLTHGGHVGPTALQCLRGRAQHNEAHIQSPRQRSGPGWCTLILVKCFLGAQPRCGTDILITFDFFSTGFFYKKFLACSVFSITPRHLPRIAQPSKDWYSSKSLPT